MPKTLEANSDYSGLNNGSFLTSYDLLSSVATYQANDGTNVLVDLVGTTQRLANVNTGIDNLFAQFRFVASLPEDRTLNSSSTCGMTNMLQTSSLGGFACTYNAVIPGYSHVEDYAEGEICENSETGQGSTGNLSLLCVSPDLVAIAKYEPYMLGQGDGRLIGIYFGSMSLPLTLMNQIQKLIVMVESIYPPLLFANTYQGPLETPSHYTDINIVPLPGLQVAVTYLTTSGTIAIQSLFTAMSAKWSQPIPYGHLSSSVGSKSSQVYTYYQINETALVEVSYDVQTRSWSPTFIYVDEG